MEAMKGNAGAGEEEEERASLVGPARRSLSRWARPSPYKPSPRRFASSFLPSRFSQPSLSENEQRLARTEGDQIANDETGIAEIEHHLKNRTFTREEADHLREVLRSRTPALHNNDTISTKASHFPINPELTLTRSLLNKTSWRSGDSIYSKASSGRTPTELAKEYMKNRGSSTPNRSTISKNQFENSGAKSSIHWPGAVLPDENILQTPQSSEGNKNMISHFSRSTFKVKNDRDSYDVFSTGKKRRLIPFEGSNKKPNIIFREESEITPELSFERREYPLNESIPVHIRKSSEKAEEILKSLERPVSISSPFKKTFLQEKKIQEKEAGKEKINREMESDSVSFANQQQEIHDSKFLQINKDSEHKSANKPALSPPKSCTAPITGGSSFSFPVPNNKFHEPPPTPTMPSSPSLTVPVVPAVPAVPTFKFGSSNSNSSRLVFSFGSNNNTDVSPSGDESLPVFKFGSEQKRDLVFSFGTKDAVCC